MRYSRRLSTRRGLIESRYRRGRRMFEATKKNPGYKYALEREQEAKKNSWNDIVDYVKDGYEAGCAFGDPTWEVKDISNIRDILANGVINDDEWQTSKHGGKTIAPIDALDIVDEVYTDDDLHRLAKDAGYSLKESRFRRGRRMFESKSHDEAIAHIRNEAEEEAHNLIDYLKSSGLSLEDATDMANNEQLLRVWASDTVERIMSAEAGDPDWDISEQEMFDIVSRILKPYVSKVRELDRKNSGVKESRFRRGFPIR